MSRVKCARPRCRRCGGATPCVRAAALTARATRRPEALAASAFRGFLRRSRPMAELEVSAFRQLLHWTHLMVGLTVSAFRRRLHPEYPMAAERRHWRARCGPGPVWRTL